MSRYPQWLHERPMSDRIEIYVSYPSTMTVKEIEEKLNWAKYRKDVSLYDGLDCIAGIKPPYLKHFEAANKDYIQTDDFALHTSIAKSESQLKEGDTKNEKI